MHREILFIYYNARPETKAYYDLGHYVDGGTEENWIIKWFLWHVFRYRDNRNRGRNATASAARQSQGSFSSGTSISTTGYRTDQSTSREMTASVFPDQADTDISNGFSDDNSSAIK